MNLKTSYLKIQSKEIKKNKNKEACIQDLENSLKRANLRVTGFKKHARNICNLGLGNSCFRYDTNNNQKKKKIDNIIFIKIITSALINILLRG